ncbi:hypothetical protein BDZ90DRAFT_62871 [Jaminaea rosea]|uniref:Uncharacterized protein n=1 Tax=Jaminaea rosea TaxID=1569628 RepID=A0A316UKG7_9BASI|nr:hypothetical protein BDZ90DRAFT_62871 [Jaminaea rosea]PWN25792.1 hypothetical protein BDZ90DRAFT_62871 [Jaminaea rosea]
MSMLRETTNKATNGEFYRLRSETCQLQSMSRPAAATAKPSLVRRRLRSCAGAERRIGIEEQRDRQANSALTDSALWRIACRVARVLVGLRPRILQADMVCGFNFTCLAPVVSLRRLQRRHATQSSMQNEGRHTRCRYRPRDSRRGKEVPGGATETRFTSAVFAV